MVSLRKLRSTPPARWRSRRRVDGLALRCGPSGERLPLDWAGAQNNLGFALKWFGERENDTAKLEEAVAAFREALKERSRERVPIDWATTQHNLGVALFALGGRERGTATLEEAVAAFREALKDGSSVVAHRWQEGRRQAQQAA